MLLKSQEHVFRFELLFKIAYFVLVLLSFNTFTARQAYLPYISYGIVGFGAIIVLFRLNHIKDFFNRFTGLLIALALGYILSAVYVSEYGYMENMQALAWMSIQYFVIFAWDRTRTSDLRNREFHVISILFLIYTSLSALISILMMIVGYERYEIIGDIAVQGGFLFNRLWGVYTDPNYGAVFAIVSALLSVYYLKRYSENKKIKAALIINIVLEYLYICYSDSRTAQVALFVSSATYCFMQMYRKKGVLKALLISCVVASFLIGGVFTVQRLSSVAQMAISRAEYASQGFSGEELEMLVDEDRIGREDAEIAGGDYSNNRFAIWSAAFRVFKTSPVVGVSFRNIVPYAEVNCPNEYGLLHAFPSMHNAIVDVMVSQGIVGLVIVFAFIALFLWELFKYTAKLTGDSYNWFACIFACVVAILASMMFYSEGFYMNTGGAFLFWCLLGYITEEFYYVKSKS